MKTMNDYDTELKANMLQPFLLEELLRRRSPLIKERNAILDTPFLFARSSLKRRLSFIESELDSIELVIYNQRREGVLVTRQLLDEMESSRKKIEESLLLLRDVK